MNRKSANEESLFEGRTREIMLLCRDNENVGSRDDTLDLMKVIRVVSGDVE